MMSFENLLVKCSVVCKGFEKLLFAQIITRIDF